MNKKKTYLKLHEANSFQRQSLTVEIQKKHGNPDRLYSTKTRYQEKTRSVLYSRSSIIPKWSLNSTQCWQSNLFSTFKYALKNVYTLLYKVETITPNTNILSFYRLKHEGLYLLCFACQGHGVLVTMTHSPRPISFIYCYNDYVSVTGIYRKP